MAEPIDPSPAPPTPKRHSPRTIMLAGLLIVGVAQFLPFDAGTSHLEAEYISRRDNPHSDHDMEGRDVGRTYYNRVGSEAEIGWEWNGYAWIVLPVLLFVFFSGVHRRPQVERWVWWGAVALLFAFCGGVTLLDYIGGWIASVGIALAALAAYRHGRAVPPPAA